MKGPAKDPSNFRHFKLNGKDEVAKFEELSDSYARLRTGHALRHLSLTAAYDYCQARADGGKLFAATLDIYVNFLLLYCESNDAGATWNRNFAKGKLEGGSVLERVMNFDATRLW